MPALPARVQKKVWYETELKGLSQSQRRRLAELSVERIRTRSANGVDARGRTFSYAPNSEFVGNNLTLTGDMMTMLEVISTDSGIVLGYEDMESLETLQAENHQNAVTYNPQWRKPFIGLTEEDKELLLSQVEQEEPSIPDSFVEMFISKLFGNQG